MRHIRPLKRDGRSVFAETRQLLCPYCHSQGTLDDTDIGWVPGPVNPDNYICLGCCEDIYSVCASDEFDTNPFHELVEIAARVEGISTIEFRKRCVEQQISAGYERLTADDTEDVQKRINQLVVILNTVKRTTGA